jgi:hypothetical protein
MTVWFRLRVQQIGREITFRAPDQLLAQFVKVYPCQDTDTSSQTTPALPVTGHSGQTGHETRALVIAPFGFDLTPANRNPTGAMAPG